jgi:hypothetical protein
MIIRHEINIITASTSGNASEIFRLNKTGYNGTIAAYLEIVATNTNGSISASAALRQSGTDVSGTSVTVPVNTSSFTVFRSSDIWSILVATAGTEFQLSGGGTGSLSVKSAKLIILQSASTVTDSESQFEIGNREVSKINTSAAALTAPKYWKYVAANYDGTCTFFAEISWSYTGTGSGTVVLQESSATLTAPTWTDKVTLVSAGTAAAATRVRSASFTPTDGRMYRITTVNSSSMGALSIYNAKIIVTQTGSDITKIEDHYLGSNTTLAAGTGLQNFLIKWDSAEWSGVDNTYIHQVHASDGNTSVVEIDAITSGSTVTNSSVSSPDNIKDSSALTMPSDQNLDVKATTNSGSVFASRIIVSVVKSAGGGGSLKPFAFGYVIG